MIHVRENQPFKFHDPAALLFSRFVNSSTLTGLESPTKIVLLVTIATPTCNETLVFDTGFEYLEEAGDHQIELWLGI